MNEPKRRAARHSLTGTGLYIALFLGLTALAVAGYWMLLPSSADKTPTNVTKPPVTTPITAEPVTPDVPEVKPEEPAEPVQSVVEVTVSEKEAEVTEPVTPVAPRLIVSPLSGETVAAFSMDELAYSETLADWRTHDGIDIKADAGTQVLAASSGTVLSVADDDLMGTTVVIAHDGGYETTYSNLQSVPTVAPEQYVSAGQVIGAVGTTSLAEASMAPHLHFSVTKDGEIIDPQEIGLNESVIALTARSGRAALVHRLELLGYDLTPEEIDATYAKFLELADRKKEIHDYDLIYLTGDIDRLKKQGLSLKFLQVTTGTLVPTATVVLKFGDRERMATATGNGPVDAAVSAIKQLIVERVVLTEFLMQAITRGSNDVGRVHVQVACGERTAHGFAAHTDTTRASVEAFLDALRSLDVTEKREEEE